MRDTKLGSMESLFQSAGYDYEYMPVDEPVNVEDKGIYIKSFNHEAEVVDFAHVTHLVRKPDSPVWQVYLPQDNTVLLEASEHHHIYDVASGGYPQLCEIQMSSVMAMLATGHSVEVSARSAGRMSPILDVSVEGNHNYFSNGVLSKNTGGNALKFYASVRLDIRRIGAIKKGEAHVGNKIRIKVVKNKLAPPFMEAETDLMFGRGIDPWGEMLDLAVEYDIIDKNGGWYSRGEKRLGQGRDNVIEHLRSKGDEMAEWLRPKIIAAHAAAQEDAPVVEETD
jgi:hypothetical protein